MHTSGQSRREPSAGPPPTAAAIGGGQRSSAPAIAGARAAERAEASRGDLRTLALAQLELAMQTLTIAGPHDAEPAVHEARKAIKRVRTVTRLLEDDLEPQARRRERAALRDASHALMEARDAAVALSALTAIARRDPARLASSIGTVRLRTALAAQKARAESALLGGDGLQVALQRLTDAHTELAVIAPSQASAAQSTRAAMRRIYRRGRRQMRRAARSDEAAQMHIWRKRVKDLRHAAEALAAHGPPAGRKQMLRAARAADALGEALGEEHDLAMLAERVGAEREMFAEDRSGRRALLKAIRRRRRKLRRRALREGRTLYRRTPKRFTRPLAEPRR